MADVRGTIALFEGEEGLVLPLSSSSSLSGSEGDLKKLTRSFFELIGAFSVVREGEGGMESSPNTISSSLSS